MPDRQDRLFRTDAVRADLRGHSVRSGFIAVGARVAQGVLQLGAVVVLARLLTPADFGIIAYVLPIALLAMSLTNGALQSAIIQREELDQEQVSGLFRISAGVNLGLCAMFAGLSPLVARFYAEPRVAAVTAAWAVAVWLASLAAIPEALLKRQMRFGRVMGAHVGALALGTALAIVAAVAGFGYWSLFIFVAVSPIVRGAVVWVSTGWRPAHAGGAAARSHEQVEVAARTDTVEGTRSGLAAMQRYWSDLAGFRFISWAGDQLDRVLVGFTGSAAALGLYDVARRWAWYPLTELIISLNDVAVSSFSRVAGHAEAYRGYVRKGLLPALALPLPAIALVWVAARDVVLTLLGDQWLEAVPFLRLMCVAAFVGAPARLLPWLYLSRGETGRQLRWSVFQTTVTIVALLIGMRAGPIGVATAFTVITCVTSWPAVAWAVRGSPVRTVDIARVVLRPAVAAVVAATILFLLQPLIPETLHPVWRLTTMAIAHAVFFSATWLVLPGGLAATREAMEALRELDPRRTVRARTDGGR
jgi:PST family polysaccharide transporter